MQKGGAKAAQSARPSSLRAFEEDALTMLRPFFAPFWTFSRERADSTLSP